MRTSLKLLLLLLIFLGIEMAWNTHHALGWLVTAASTRQASLPTRMLWVWERPEDLYGFPDKTGIAVLEETLRLGSISVPTPRRQPLVIPQDVLRVAVVRIETEVSFAAHSDDKHLLQSTVDNLVQIAARPGIAALQLDFDAKRSERAFYRRLLIELRRKMPAGLPLDITALASWCSTDDWIAGLPVNEATPMFFRMEPDRRRMLLTSPAYRVHEPLCEGSVGVSTTEPWPSDAAGKRIYIFSDCGWAEDLPQLTSSEAIDRKQP